MIHPAVSLITGALLLGGGCWAGRSVGSGRESVPVFFASAGSVARPDDVLTLQLDRILKELEELRGARSSAGVPPSAQPIRAQEGGTHDLEAIEQRIAALLEEIKQRTASIDELARLKPSPDFAALTTLRTEFSGAEGGARRLTDRVSGMDARDVVRAFGVPTWKLVVSGSHWTMESDHDFASTGSRDPITAPVRRSEDAA